MFEIEKNQKLVSRTNEPELMLDLTQAEQYAAADFEVPHSRYPIEFKARYPEVTPNGTILDLGCGPADVTIRFAKLFPNATVAGVDGSAEMLRLAQQRVDREQDSSLTERVNFIEALIPMSEKKLSAELIICNGTLHHFHRPADFWKTVKAQGQPGTIVYVTDLLRPKTEAELEDLVSSNCYNQHPVHVNDYSNSLRAAFNPEELQQQLKSAGLAGCLRVEVPDRTRVIVHGRL